MAHDEAFASRHIYAGEELWRREFDSFDVFCRKRDAARAMPTSAPGASAAQAAISTSEPSTTSYLRAPTSDGA